MHKPGVAFRISTALSLTAVLSGCNKAPTTPTTTPPSTAPGGAPTTMRVGVTGPTVLAAGETAQFAATAHFADGSTRNVTNESVWISANPPVVSISNTGLATAHQTGEAYIRAAYNGGENGQRGVLVLPKATFKVGGYVEEDGEVPVPEARVEVTAGTGAGLSVLTYPFPSGGSYTLLGLSGDTEFRVTKEGYQPLVRTVRVTEQEQRIDFELTPLIPRAVVSGTYTLTITAAAECRSKLPEAARTRTYTAVVTQDGARLTATLSGADFYSADGNTYNHFVGAVEPKRVLFTLRNLIIGDPLGDTDPDHTAFSDVFEQLTPSMFLAVSGMAETTLSPAGVAGTLNNGAGWPRAEIATVQRIGTGPLDWQITASCRTTGHQIVVSR
jgi:Big-like domain-containing protein